MPGVTYSMSVSLDGYIVGRYGVPRMTHISATTAAVGTP